MTHAARAITAALLLLSGPAFATMNLLSTTSSCDAVFAAGRALLKGSNNVQALSLCHLEWQIDTFCDTQTGNLLYVYHGPRYDGPVSQVVQPGGCEKEK